MDRFSHLRPIGLADWIGGFSPPNMAMANLSGVLRRLIGAAAIALVGVTVATGTASAATTVVSRPLSVQDLPPGFKVIGVPLQSSPCSELYLPKEARHHVVVGFRSASLAIEEAVTLGANSRTVYELLDDRYATCRSIPLLREHGGRLSGIGKTMQLPRIGDQSQAFRFQLKVNGYDLNDDVVLFRQNSACGLLAFISTDALDQQSIELISALAASKAYTYLS